MFGLFFISIFFSFVAVITGFAKNEPINENTRTIIAAHNTYRSNLGIYDLIWDNDLASHAQYWASILADSNQFEHSPAAVRIGEGENLFKGTAGHYSLDDMVNTWGKEKQFFKYGVFPDVTIPGIDWNAVSHYTQMIWRNTHKVGCGGKKGEDQPVLCI
jgi:hypothetical protein